MAKEKGTSANGMCDTTAVAVGNVSCDHLYTSAARDTRVTRPRPFPDETSCETFSENTRLSTSISRVEIAPDSSRGADVGSSCFSFSVLMASVVNCPFCNGSSLGASVEMDDSSGEASVWLWPSDIWDEKPVEARSDGRMFVT